LTELFLDILNGIESFLSLGRFIQINQENTVNLFVKLVDYLIGIAYSFESIAPEQLKAGLDGTDFPNPWDPITIGGKPFFIVSFGMMTA
jgi:hypothetical protein